MSKDFQNISAPLAQVLASEEIADHRVIILGSTGSIGTSALKVVSAQTQLPEDEPRVKVTGLFAYQSVTKLIEQISQFNPEVAGIIDESKFAEFDQAFAQLPAKVQEKTKVILGKQEILNYVANAESDIRILNAIVGFAGLEFTLTSLEAGKTLLLANKESLVVGGHLVKALLSRESAKGGKLIPIDSEHNAIYQSLPPQIQENICHCDLEQAGVGHIILTGSGGPFLNLPLDEFKNINAAQALKHPNWSMGPKVTIDSSTMMNKGLEFIEAAVLFNCGADKIKTIIHPQSIVHSGVEYLDKSMIVQMGPTDMCVPIAYALNYPRRGISSVQSLDLFKLQGLTFAPVDFARYPNFKLAIESFAKGFVYTCALNAVNEITVDAFIKGKISYLDIYKFNRESITTLEHQISTKQYQPEIDSFAGLQALDKYARDLCLELINAEVAN